MNYIINARRSIMQDELIKPSEEELSIFKECIKVPEYLNRIYKVNNHMYGYIYVNFQNGNIMSAAVTLGDQVCTIITDDIIKIKDSRYNNFLENNEFYRCITMADGQYAFLTFDLIKDKIPNELLCDVFLDAYRLLDYGFNEIVKIIDISEILKLRRLSEEELSELSEYIDDDGNITIYRAQGTKSTPLELAISWTVDLEVAKNFATNHNLESDGIIYEAKVNVKNITSYIATRSEFEVIVDYKYLKNIKKY